MKNLYTPNLKIRGHKEISPSEVILMKSIVNYTEIVLQDGETILISKTLKNFEKQLQNSSFFRIHKSFLVNLNYFESYERDEMVLRLTNNIELGVSRRRQSAFLKQLKNARNNKLVAVS